MTTNISIIGAGSGAFSLSLIRDLCLTKNLEGSTVCFMDIDPGRLEASFTLCKRYAEELGFKLNLKKTLDRREALVGADFVINTALAAGHHRLQEGWAIARRYGYNWGSSFHVMYDEAFWINYYQFRLFESVIEDALAICPQAYHLLVANPVLAATTHLYRKYPQVKLVGLCHGFGHVYSIADFLGLDRDHVNFEIAGVNHFVWLTSFFCNGEDVFPLLNQWIEQESQVHWASGRNGPLSRKTVDLYKRFGVVPIGDTSNWSGAAWPWFYHSDEETEKSWGEHPIDGWNSYFDWVKKNAKDMARVSADPKARMTEYLPPQHSGEPMVPIIEAVACDIPRVVVGNVHNTAGYVPGIPQDFEVELPIMVSRRGMQPLHTKPLPNAILSYLLRERVATVNMELEALNQGSKDLLLQLILTDPWSRSVKQASAFLDEILAMPYHAEMREHYR